MANIKRTSEALKRQQESLLKIKKEKDDLLADKLQQNQEFEKAKSDYNITLTKLKNDASGLKRDIENSKKAISAIDKIAVEAIKKHENTYKDNTKTVDNNKNPIEVDPERMGTKKTTTNSVVVKTEEKKGIKTEGGIVFSSFEKAKGFLQMPVKQGFITGKFGTYQHPAYPKVLLENHGVDIRTNKDEVVLAVFGGEIIAVNKVPGAGILVMIQHSKEYYTVYAKLNSTNVKIGQRVNINEHIGITGVNQDGVTELQFQVWKGQIRLNPEDWLSSQ
jgi:septal ring factor EnvC (AmiA/AmiB activator)